MHFNVFCSTPLFIKFKPKELLKSEKYGLLIQATL